MLLSMLACRQMTAGKIICLPPKTCNMTYFSVVGDTCEKVQFAYGITPYVFNTNNPMLACNATGLTSSTYVCVDGGSGENFTV